MIYFVAVEKTQNLMENVVTGFFFLIQLPYNLWYNEIIMILIWKISKIKALISINVLQAMF